jgi:archaellum component FlaC
MSAMDLAVIDQQRCGCKKGKDRNPCYNFKHSEGTPCQNKRAGKGRRCGVCSRNPESDSALKKTQGGYKDGKKDGKKVLRIEAPGCMEVDKAAKRVRVTNLKLELAAKQITALRGENKDLREKLEKKKDTVTRAEERIHELENMLENAQSSASAMNDNLSSLAEENTRLREEYTLARGAHTCERIRLREEITRLRVENARLSPRSESHLEDVANMIVTETMQKMNETGRMDEAERKRWERNCKVAVHPDKLAALRAPTAHMLFTWITQKFAQQMES